MDSELLPLGVRARSGPSHQEVAGVLRRRIMLGGFSPDRRLPTERELAAVLEVSRNTVRKAVRELAEEGLVETTLGRTGGTRVVAQLPSAAERSSLISTFRQSLDHHMEYRAMVEPAAAGLAAERADQLVLTELAETLALPSDDLASYHRADTLLHLRIAAAAGNPVLTEAIAAARAQMFGDLNVLWLDSDWDEVYGSDHGEVLRRDHAPIVAAVNDHDPESAREAMARHLRESHAQFSKLLTRLPSSTSSTRSGESA
ncbi:FadR/GntR family transcriptional regulator [Naumannella halotolerans]|uniref:GntR family transcriptional repressor for pyruvate dehydrogenase complex n=1 Tax=Naumannella halotolerans TaxID=993414 RepID=A0A4R7J3Z0_9ACTN|nr:FCD domain-containing protein [Naumannella halotolerans]TDT31069.1 GntR family transcriptional repressor for pyruvate dehydrogenase complex [Naumannella halotolerans]